MQDIKASQFRMRRTRVQVLLGLLRTYAIALGIILLGSVLSLAAWHMYGRMARASEGETAAQNQLERVQARQIEVTANLERLQTQTGQEGELRQRYGVARPGEGVIQIVSASATSSAILPKLSNNFFIQIWHIFFP